MKILVGLNIELNISPESYRFPLLFFSQLSYLDHIHKHNSKNGRPLIIHVSRLVSYSLCELRRENFRGIKCQKNANTECIIVRIVFEGTLIQLNFSVIGVSYSTFVSTKIVATLCVNLSSGCICSKKEDGVKL